MPPEDVARSETELKARFELARTVKGTLQFHRFVPVSKSRLHVNMLGAQTNDPELVPISWSDAVDMVNEAARSLHVQEQSFVCCLYRMTISLGFAWWMKSQTSMGPKELPSCIHMGQQDSSIGH